MDEKRSEERVSCQIPARLQGPDELGEFFEQSAVIENYSAAGACIQVARPVMRGAFIVLSDFDHDQECAARVSTVWQSKDGKGMKLGLRFLLQEENWLAAPRSSKRPSS